MGRYLLRFRLTPYPRASIAAAKSNDRASDSSNSGIATLRYEDNPFVLCPRKRCAVLILVKLVTSWGKTVLAITTETPNSYI